VEAADGGDDGPCRELTAIIGNEGPYQAFVAPLHRCDPRAKLDVMVYAAVFGDLSDVSQNLRLWGESPLPAGPVCE